MRYRVRSMSRLFTWEAGLVIVGGLAAVIALSLDAGAGIYTVFLALGWLVASVPLAFLVQNALVPLYLRIGWADRALTLATLIREGAPNRKLRDVASVDVAMVQVAMGRYDDALRNLCQVRLAAFGDETRALLLANRAYCRAHLGRDLETAREEIDEALALSPDEGILAYVDGLVRFKEGDLGEARRRILESLEREPAPDLPVPGERPWMLYQIARREGTEDAEAWLRRARREGRRGPFRQAIATA